MTGSRLDVRLLGGFEVAADGRPVPRDAWRRRYAAALVKLLALAPGHRLVREEAIEALWPGSDTATGGANLRKAAHHARRIIGVDDSVVLDGATVGLLPGGRVETDVARFEAEARAALATADPEACRRLGDDAIAELLPDDPYEPWADAHRRRVRALQRDLLVAGRLWGRLLALEPTSELAHREIMRDRLARGDRAGAMRQFDELRTVLRRELGVSPDPESVALYEQVLSTEGPDAPTPSERARALVAWGVVHWERRDLAEAERTAREVRALAVDAGLGRELAEASELLGIVAYAQGRWREVFGRELLDVVRRDTGLFPFVYDANLCISEFALHEADGHDAIASLAADLLRTADEAGSDLARAVGLLLRGEVGLLSGGADADAIVDDLTTSARLHQAGISPSGLALATERLARFEALRGSADRADELHRRAEEIATQTAVAGHLLPLVLGGVVADANADADMDAASAALDRADATLAGMGTCAPCSMDLHVSASIVLARRGDPAAARERLEQASGTAAMWRGGPWHAAVAEASAVIGHAEGVDLGETRQRYVAAADAFAAARRPRDAERCRAALASLE